MIINPYTLKKTDLLTFFTKRCVHNHKYCEHPNCFIKEQNHEPRIGFLDIETNGFNANFHIMGSYAIKVAGEDKVYGRAITPKELSSKDLDKKIVKELVKDLLKFDKVVTYYGTYFDLPFIRTRALAHNIEDFPIYGLLHHTDIYFLVKAKLKLAKRSLHQVCNLLGIEGKDHVEGRIWQRAFINRNAKDMAEIFDHNKRDVLVLEKVFEKLIRYSRNTKKSIWGRYGLKFLSIES